MNTDERDRIMRPFMSIMLPIRLPRDIILRVVLYLIPPPALQWILRDFHYSRRHVRVPMLHEVVGAGYLPTHIDMLRYNCGTDVVFERNQWRFPSSCLTRSRSYLHGTISRMHLALLNIVYWAPMSSLSRRNVIRTIEICRKPHYPPTSYGLGVFGCQNLGLVFTAIVNEQHNPGPRPQHNTATTPYTRIIFRTARARRGCTQPLTSTANAAADVYITFPTGHHNHLSWMWNGLRDAAPHITYTPQFDDDRRVEILIQLRRNGKNVESQTSTSHPITPSHTTTLKARTSNANTSNRYLSYTRYTINPSNVHILYRLGNLTAMR